MSLNLSLLLGRPNIVSQALQLENLSVQGYFRSIRVEIPGADVVG